MGKSGGGNLGSNMGGQFTTQDIASYQAELMGAPRAQANAIPAAIGLERELMPLLQSHYFGTLGSSARGLESMYQGMEGSSIANQGRYGNQLLGMYGQMGGNATAAARTSLDANTRNIYDTFTGQAASDLALGTSLNQQETSIAQGSARAAAQARGLQFSRQGGDLEILNTYGMGQKRQAERRQTAGQAYQMGRDLQNYGAQAYLAPSIAGSSIYSIPSMVQGAGEAVGGYGPQFLQPESQYMANIRATRMQGEAASAQARATRSAGMASAGGAIAGAAIVAI